MPDAFRYAYAFIYVSDVDGVRYPSVTLDRSRVMMLARQYAQAGAVPENFERLAALMEKSDEELASGQGFALNDEGSLYFVVAAFDEPARILWTNA